MANIRQESENFPGSDQWVIQLSPRAAAQGAEALKEEYLRKRPPLRHYFTRGPPLRWWTGACSRRYAAVDMRYRFFVDTRKVQCAPSDPRAGYPDIRLKFPGG